MTGYVLTWNPDRSQLDDARWSVWLETLRAGDPVRVAWRMGSTRHGVTRGQRVFLLRQGSRGRGLVARGVVEHDGVHPDDRPAPGRPAFHVRVVWQDGLNVADAVDLIALEQTTRDFDWRHVYASGHRLTDRDVDALDRLWRELTALS
ncbi:hypothetical protein ACXR2U_19910 [Jatrophihabitans sp. YIM 134969]